MNAFSISVSLSKVAAFLTGPLERDVDAVSLGRMQEALATNFALHFVENRRHDVFSLEGSIMPPKPILRASFTVRIRWSTWFKALSPSGRPILLTVIEDRVRPQTFATAAQPLHSPELPRTLCYVRNEDRFTFAASSLKHSNAPFVPDQYNVLPSSRILSKPSLRSPTPAAQIPIRSATLYSPETRAQDDCAEASHETGQNRRARRQRGGVKHKQRGIYVDKSKLDVTPYLHSGGVTGTLTGGVMLGRHAS
ncbi:hypothetical protein EXIGLDRAFT_693189 [Exidia glandulosa HHB12029]|uniref:Anti-proliferative protein domain-containing protein n=1 Tax=Exidia glandulosa HHB12029 TaxID=1314781 RepID=A0A165HGV8_EXIGL|nr:hypothetical protein EXIGLDRAFT_693189 [Exidia glandulosa HHB12029]